MRGYNRHEIGSNPGLMRHARRNEAKTSSRTQPEQRRAIFGRTHAWGVSTLILLAVALSNGPVISDADLC